MISQSTIFGGLHKESVPSKDAAKILTKYPACLHNTGLFFYYAAKEKMDWLSQQDEQRLSEFREFCSSIGSLDRAKRDFISSHT